MIENKPVNHILVLILTKFENMIYRIEPSKCTGESCPGAHDDQISERAKHVSCVVRLAHRRRPRDVEQVKTSQRAHRSCVWWALE